MVFFYLFVASVRGRNSGGNNQPLGLFSAYLVPAVDHIGYYSRCCDGGGQTFPEQMYLDENDYRNQIKMQTACGSVLKLPQFFYYGL